MGRPKKVKEPVVKEVKEKVNKNANWKKLTELKEKYEYEMHEYQWAVQHTEHCKGNLEEAHRVMVLFEANNNCKYID